MDPPMTERTTPGTIHCFISNLDPCGSCPIQHDLILESVVNTWNDQLQSKSHCDIIYTILGKLSWCKLIWMTWGLLLLIKCVANIDSYSSFPKWNLLWRKSSSTYTTIKVKVILDTTLLRALRTPLRSMYYYVFTFKV